MGQQSHVALVDELLGAILLNDRDDYWQPVLCENSFATIERWRCASGGGLPSRVKIKPKARRENPAKLAHQRHQGGSTGETGRCTK